MAHIANRDPDSILFNWPSSVERRGRWKHRLGKRNAPFCYLFSSREASEEAEQVELHLHWRLENNGCGFFGGFSQRHCTAGKLKRPLGNNDSSTMRCRHAGEPQVNHHICSFIWLLTFFISPFSKRHETPRRKATAMSLSYLLHVNRIYIEREGEEIVWEFLGRSVPPRRRAPNWADGCMNSPGPPPLAPRGVMHTGVWEEDPIRTLYTPERLHDSLGTRSTHLLFSLYRTMQCCVAMPTPNGNMAVLFKYIYNKLNTCWKTMSCLMEGSVQVCQAPVEGLLRKERIMTHVNLCICSIVCPTKLFHWLKCVRVSLSCEFWLFFLPDSETYRV